VNVDEAPSEVKTYEDQRLTCVECGGTFPFTAGEQRFFYERMGWDTPPKRCHACRQARKSLSAS